MYRRRIRSSDEVYCRKTVNEGSGCKWCITTHVATKAAFIGGAGTLVIGTGLALGYLAYSGHSKNEKERIDIEREIYLIKNLPIDTKISDGGFMSD